MFSIEFRYLAGDDWVALDASLAPALLDHYLSIADLSCCDMQGGFFIAIDGRPWSDDGTVDEFWMTMSWLSALREVLAGAETARAFPWEESQLTLRRVGAELELEDVHHSGHIAMPLVRVPLRPFAEQMLSEFDGFTAMAAALRTEIASRRAAGVSAQTEALLAEAERNLPAQIVEEGAALRALLA